MLQFDPFTPRKPSALWNPTAALDRRLRDGQLSRDQRRRLAERCAAVVNARPAGPRAFPALVFLSTRLADQDAVVIPCLLAAAQLPSADPNPAFMREEAVGALASSHMSHPDVRKFVLGLIENAPSDDRAAARAISNVQPAPSGEAEVIEVLLRRFERELASGQRTTVGKNLGGRLATLLGPEHLDRLRALDAAHPNADRQMRQSLAFVISRIASAK